MNQIARIRADQVERPMGRAGLMARRINATTLRSAHDRAGQRVTEKEAKTARRIARVFGHSGAGLVALTERTADQCCWPHDTPNGLMFCGQPVVARPFRHEAGYCAACATRLVQGGGA